LTVTEVAAPELRDTSAPLVFAVGGRH